jgi:hypothetical protein
LRPLFASRPSFSAFATAIFSSVAAAQIAASFSGVLSLIFAIPFFMLLFYGNIISIELSDAISTD